MACAGKTKKYTDQPAWFDPLGPSSIDPKTGKQTFTPSGGVEQRKAIFDQLSATRPETQAAAERTAAGLQTAAADPGWAQAADLARRTIAGEYLQGSPQLDAAMAQVRRAGGAQAANAAAQTRSQFARAGMGMSTAHQQAEQATRAAATAATDTAETQARLQNYLSERAAQQAGAGALREATGVPLEYLAAVPEAQRAGLAQEAEIVQGLTGGGQVATPSSTMVKQPGAFDYAAVVANTAASAAPDSV